MTRRPTFAPVGEEMKRRSALLVAEVGGWPGVRVGRMFGMQSLYRNDLVFGMLPNTKGLWEPDAIMVKIYPKGEAKKPGRRESERWQSVAVASDADLTAALERLDAAYRSAK